MTRRGNVALPSTVSWTSNRSTAAGRIRSRGVTVADVARDTIRMLQRFVPGAAAAPSYSDDAEDFEDDDIDDDGDEDVMEDDDGTA